MKLEVTEKEAREIYTDRYLKSKGKMKYLPIFLIGIAVLAGAFAYSADRQWLSFVVLIVIAGPGLFIGQRLKRASDNYTKSMIENEKGENL